MGEQLTKEELDERIAILHRFKTLLEQQRNKFKEYLKILEMQENKISTEDADAIIAHSELETQIVQGIGSLQKVIIPMQQLYQTSKAASYNPEEAIPVTELQNDLLKLQSQVLQQNEKNRELLHTHIAEIRKKMGEMKNPYRNHNSIYAEKGKVGSLVEINA